MARETRCQRCGDLGRAEHSSKPSARPFRKSLRGNCAACIVVLFFKSEDGVGFALPENFDPEGLRLPHLRQQFARMLAVGNSELTPDQVNWDAVIAKWNLETERLIQ
jgi:hypothetical protein